MSEHEHEDLEIIVLQDEEGVEREFHLADALEVDDKRYAILVPVDEDDEDDGALILRIDEDEDGEEFLVPIEDDDEFERVADAYEQLLDDDDWDEEDDDEE